MRIRLTAACALLPILAVTAAHADSAAASACAARLPPDARVIYNATLPKVTPGTNLRDLLTTNARSLALSGTIDRGNARQSATAAGECLQRINS